MNNNLNQKELTTYSNTDTNNVNDNMILNKNSDLQNTVRWDEGLTGSEKRAILRELNKKKSDKEDKDGVRRLKTKNEEVKKNTKDERSVEELMELVKKEKEAKENIKTKEIDNEGWEIVSKHRDHTDTKIGAQSNGQGKHNTVTKLTIKDGEIVVKRNPKPNVLFPELKSKDKVKRRNSNPKGVEGSSGSESEEEELIPASQMEIKVHCPFEMCSKNDKLWTDPAEIGPHLKEEHNVVFKGLHYTVTYLEKYLTYWSGRLKNLDPDEMQKLGIRVLKDNGFMVVIDPNQLDEDREIRTNLQQEQLQEILDIQEHERETEAKQPRKCLFCQAMVQNRKKLFQHMYLEHGFNIGLPDNLVFVEEFLQLLERKMDAEQCIYCEKTFKDALVLRKHMRKKKHFKIHPRNHRYDRFYIVNYAEPGISWEALEKEADENDGSDGRDEDDAEVGEDPWQEWLDTDPEITEALFDGHRLESPEQSVEYVKQKYGFDLIQIKEDLELDFYSLVKLINYLRFRFAAHQCHHCNIVFPTEGALINHYETTSCTRQPIFRDQEFFSDATYLLPIIESDPLLMYVESLYEDEPLMSPDDSSLDVTQRAIISKIASLDLEK